MALAMCLSLLSACGSGDKAVENDPPESESVSSVVQQPVESKMPEEQPTTSEPLAEEKPQDPPQEEPKEENNAGTEFLALLQEEWNNGFVEGEGPRHTYFGLGHHRTEANQ